MYAMFHVFYVHGQGSLEELVESVATTSTIIAISVSVYTTVTVESLNKGHVGDNNDKFTFFVPCREVVFSEVVKTII